MLITTATKTRALAQRIFDDSRATRPIIGFSAQKPEFECLPVEQSFERAAPEDMGVSSQVILDFLHKLRDDMTLNMHSVMILKNGKVICEAEFGSYRLNVPKYTFSACKSITSLAIGMLADEGVISLDDKLTDIFAERLSALNKIKFPDLTVRRLLTMQSGVLFNELQCMTQEDWVDSFFDSVTYTSSKTFNYNSLNTYMLSAIVREKTGLGLSEFLAPRLFEPLGISEYYWEKCPRGIEKGGWGLYIKPEDFLKIAVMVMDGGLWKGERLISEQYLREATKITAHAPEDFGDYDYGYQIWRCRDSDIFLFNGMLGQNILGFRDNSIIVVSNAGNDEAFQQSNFFKYVREAFDRPFLDSADHSKRSARELASYITKLKTVRPPVYQALNRCPGEQKYPKGCQLLDGRYFSLPNNSAGLVPTLFQAVQNNYTGSIKTVGFAIEDQRLYLNITEKSADFHIPLGFDEPVRSNIDFHGESFIISAQAWLARNEYENVVLTIKTDMLETPCTRVLKFIFSPLGIELHLDERPGKRLLFDALDTYGETRIGKSLLAGSFGSTDIIYLKHRIERTFSPRLPLREIKRS